MMEIIRYTVLKKESQREHNVKEGRVRVKLVIGSPCNVPEEMICRYDIRVVPLLVNIGGDVPMFDSPGGLMDKGTPLLFTAKLASAGQRPEDIFPELVKYREEFLISSN